ncbi:lipoprotein [Streptomyces longwoodensis]|uniref:lipoprotein n=1 Tax=Streptomyces longwoodensis TaxID=68231 RepID=UPI0033D5B7A6
MRYGVGSRTLGRGGRLLGGGLVLAAAGCLAGALTACGAGGDHDAATPTASGSGAGASAAVAARGATIGAPDSACRLPVTFALAKNWKPESTVPDSTGSTGPTGSSGSTGSTGSSGSSATPADDLAAEIADALLHQGPVTAVCEVDAKPAGHIGFLRVWTGEPGGADARSVLASFVGAEKGAGHATYRAFTTGGLSGTEVEYRVTSEILESTKTERALAVTTPDGPVVVHLGGLDDEEHRAMLPAYELAKSTLRVTAR